MGIAALIAWVLAAVGGFVMLGRWVAHGGLRSSGASRFPPGLILGHFGLAAAGLVVWIVYLVLDARVLSWISLALLVVVALLGFTMFRLWVPAYRARAATATVGTRDPAGGPGAASEAGAAPEPAESHLPVAVVGAHGVLAVATVVLVLLAALGVPSS
ncbi:hypothetical protein LWC33_21925 [Pseudonocardia sp. RS11V-5]|uniref:hypothetical protein n=1 Tax=Pseudonocardia terrae TaxID=2905831 RepID=UPI001E51DAE3|nr:hypothetical protein [Pseudonocardia terrae]MCE3554099.1 hypothetical protein [Pseudonocardia terrae]